MATTLRISLLALLVTLLVAPAAYGLIPCEDCEMDMPPSTRCAGYCNGQQVQFCSDYFFLGCSGGYQYASTAVTSDEAFLQQLEQDRQAVVAMELKEPELKEPELKEPELFEALAVPTI